MLAAKTVNPGLETGEAAGEWGARECRAVGDARRVLPGQSAVQALSAVDIYTLLLHSSPRSRNGESPEPCPALLLRESTAPLRQPV